MSPEWAPIKWLLATHINSFKSHIGPLVVSHMHCLWKNTLSVPYCWHFVYLIWTLNFVFQLRNTTILKSHCNSSLDHSLVNDALYLNLLFDQKNPPIRPTPLTKSLVRTDNQVISLFGLAN